MVQYYVRAAAATPEVKVADTCHNREAVLKQLQEAAQEGARLVVFPELVLTAYSCADLFHQECLLRSAKEALDMLAEESKALDVLAVVGLPYRFGSKLYNVAAVLHRGRVLALIPKTNLPNYSEFYEARWFAAGPQEAELFAYTSSVTGETYEVPFGTDILLECDSIPGLCIAAELCEDAWVPCPPATAHALAGANVIVNCSASDETVGKESYRRTLISTSSARLSCAYIYANAGEGESTQDLVFGGQNLICECGSLLAESRRFTTGVLYADLDLERIQAERSRLTTFPSEEGYRKAYHIVHFSYKQGSAQGQKTQAECGADIRRHINPHPFVPTDRKERSRRCEEILSIQALGLKKRLQHTGVQTAVLGISGGLDSTLALLVTAKAFDMLGLPRTQIICVTMPCFGTTDRTYNNAVTLTNCLGATLREINIRASVLQHFADIGHDPADHSVTYENAQARERTQILMDVANQTAGLVIGTGDMSELALGWATYNGDHMSMYAVNAGVPKTLVRHLVQFDADTTKDAALAACLRDVLDTPVSPELLPPTAGGTISQKTEDLVGPYELHDFYLYQILRYGYAPKRVYHMAVHAFAADTEDPVYDRETILKWLKIFCRRFFSQQFKRSCLPDGPKVGSVAVSPRGDLRMPSDAVAALWLKELEELG